MLYVYISNWLTVNKKLKENINRIVGEGLGLILSKLKISKPSPKMEKSLKRQARKLVGHLKTEIKRQGHKEEKSKPKRSKPIKKAAKSK